MSRATLTSPLSSYSGRMPSSAGRRLSTTYNDTYTRYSPTNYHNRDRYSPSPGSVPRRTYESQGYRTSSIATRTTANPRPLPPGPGPLDSYGRKMSITDTSRYRSRVSDTSTLGRTGPLKATHSTRVTSPSYRSHRSMDRNANYDPVEGSSFSRSRRTTSVSDLTADIDNLSISSLSRSKRMSGSLRDINYNSPVNDKKNSTSEKIEDLFESSRSRNTPSKSYYNTSANDYDYNSTEQRTDTRVLPDITGKGVSRAASRDLIRNTDTSAPSPVDRGSRRSSFSKDSTGSLSNLAQRHDRGSPTKGSEQKHEKGLVGLRNLGNTCFMNSILQCLSNTRPLLEYCLNGDYQEDCSRSTSSMKGALFKAYAKLMESLWKSNDSYISPTAFKSQLQKFAPRFVGYNQQDSQEFLVYLVEGLHEDANRVKSKQKRIIPDDDEDDKLTATEKARTYWKRYLAHDNSKMVDIFVGQLKSSLKCTTCGYVSVTFDPFWDISLPIPKKAYGDTSLPHCFDMFTQEEVLDGDESPTCAKCKQTRKCTKSFSIQKFPKVLVLHLKRFNQESYMRSKLSTNVDFPLNDLDLTQYAADKSTPSAVYNLYAVSNHSGTPFSGHYTAYCKHPYSGEWNHFNDSRVTSINSRSVRSQEAYVLFYELNTQSSRL